MKVLCKMVGSVLILSAMAGEAQAKQDKKPKDNDVPEVNLGTAGSALTLLAGGLLILKDRFSSK